MDDGGDDWLIEQARRGDHRAFAALLGHHDESLRRLTWRLLRDRDVMDDVMQEAYVKAYVSLDAYRGEGSFGAWLYRIAYRACLDELRRPARARLVAIDDDRDVPDGGRGPGATATDRVTLEAALDALSVEHRAAVLLVDVQGFSYDETAEVLDVAPGTVASRVSRARAALRAALEDDSETGGRRARA